MADIPFSTQVMLVFMDDDERQYYESPERTEEERKRIYSECEELWNAIPAATEAELETVMGERNWEDTQHNPDARNLYRIRWKKDRKAAIRAELVKRRVREPTERSPASIPKPYQSGNPMDGVIPALRNETSKPQSQPPNLRSEIDTTKLSPAAIKWLTEQADSGRVFHSMEEFEKEFRESQRPRYPIPFANPSEEWLREDRINRAIQSGGWPDPKDLADRAAAEVRYQRKVAEAFEQKRKELEAEATPQSKETLPTLDVGQYPQGTVAHSATPVAEDTRSIVRPPTSPKGLGSIDGGAGTYDQSLRSRRPQPDQPSRPNTSETIPSTFSVRIQRGALTVAGVLAVWLFEKFDAPVWLVVTTLVVCLASVVLVRWLEKTKTRRILFVLFLVLYVVFALLAAIRFREPPVPSHPLAKVDEKQLENDQAKDVATVDPVYLVGLYKKYNSAQADELVKSDIGKWTLPIPGTVNDVTGDKTGALMTISVKGSDGSLLYAVVASFNEQRWIDRALLFRPNESVTIKGRVEHVRWSGILLTHCEIVE